MNSKSAKKLRRLANMVAANKSPEEKRKVYQRLKSIHKSNKKEI
tara:strand:+ start:4214 stop:4345 length:132 start_codon:yes stop_codon:yes gene_type:complete